MFINLPNKKKSKLESACHLQSYANDPVVELATPVETDVFEPYTVVTVGTFETLALATTFCSIAVLSLAVVIVSVEITKKYKNV